MPGCTDSRTDDPGCDAAMGGPSPFDRTCALARRRAAAPLFALFVFPGLACASIATSDAGAGAEAAALASTERAATDGVGSGVERSSIRPPSYGPPGQTPGIPSDAELEAAGAVVGEVLIDNQNIFNLEDPKDDVKLFRLANHLHSRTRKAIVRDQLLFRSGERYSRRLIDESERILRAHNYFYDAWIRPVRYHDGQVDLRVTTRDVWTLNPGFNFGRSGGSNSTGVQLEEINLLGTGAGLKVAHTKDVDRTKSQLEVSDMHAFGTWTAVDVNYADLSDGRMRDLTLNHPFYALDTRWAAGLAGMDDVQTDSLFDRTGDASLGTTASVRLGGADAAFGSSRSALLLHSSAGRGFRDGGSSTLLLAGTLTGRLENGEPRNVLLAGSVRYYVEQGKNWLFFTTLQGTKGWRLDLEDQILLGGDNGLRGYPLRYQDGTARALWTVEQRFFTDWYPFRLFRVGAAVFFDTGRTWGAAPLAAPGLGLLKDAGFGLRFGNSRSGLGNVVHVDLAFPFNGDSSIKRVQFLVQTEQRF